MSSTRPDLLYFLVNDQALKRFALRYQVAATDTPEGYRAVLDSMARALGFVEDLIGFTIESTDVAKAQDVAKYYSLAMFYELAAMQVDTEEDTPRQVRKSSQGFSQLGKLLARYELLVAGYGIPIAAPQAQIEMGRLGLDYLTPRTFIGEEGVPGW